MSIRHVELRAASVSAARNGNRPTPFASFGSVLHSTPHLSRTQAEHCLADAWTAIVGQPPNSATRGILTAHWALETDAGRSMPGFNFAGIKATPSAPAVISPTLEGHGATQHRIFARFRAYDSAEAGAYDYVRLLSTRYPAALAAAQAGDVTDFARALAHGGYFTADPLSYERGLKQRLEAAPDGVVAPRGSTEHGATSSALREAALGGLLHALRERDEG